MTDHENNNLFSHVNWFRIQYEYWLCSSNDLSKWSSSSNCDESSLWSQIWASQARSPSISNIYLWESSSISAPVWTRTVMRFRWWSIRRYRRGGRKVIWKSAMMRDSFYAISDILIMKSRVILHSTNSSTTPSLGKPLGLGLARFMSPKCHYVSPFPANCSR